MTAEPQANQFHGANASVRTYLTAEVITVAASASVRAAAAIMREASVGVLVVGTRSSVEGLVSERDVVRTVAEGVDLDATTVADIASKHVIWIDAGNTIGDAAEEMMEDYVRHVLVRGDEGLAGVLSIRDVLDAFIT